MFAENYVRLLGRSIREYFDRNSVFDVRIGGYRKAFRLSRLGRDIVGKLERFRTDAKRDLQPRAVYLGRNAATDRLHFVLLNEKYGSLDREEFYSSVYDRTPFPDPTNLFEVDIESPRLSDTTSSKSYLSGRVMCEADAIKTVGGKDFDAPLRLESNIYLPIPPGKKRGAGLLVLGFDKWGTGSTLFEESDGSVPSKENHDRIVDELVRLVLTSKRTGRYYSATSFSTGVRALDMLFQTHLSRYMECLTLFDNYVLHDNVKITRSASVSHPLRLRPTRARPWWRVEDTPAEVLNAGAHYDLRELELIKVTPYDYLGRVFDPRRHRLLPVVRYTRNLGDIEPLLRRAGKREHYLHMFNTYLIGNSIITKMVQFPEHDGQYSSRYIQSMWAQVALAHDIGYPLQEVSKEMEAFLSVYFEKGQVPSFLCAWEFFYGYGKFREYRQTLSKGLELLWPKDDDTRHLLDGLIDRNLMLYRDHAVESALLAMAELDRSFTIRTSARPEVWPTGAGEALLVVGLAIMLHNLPHWRHHYAGDLAVIEGRSCSGIEPSVPPEKLRSDFLARNHMSGQGQELRREVERHKRLIGGARLIANWRLPALRRLSSADRMSTATTVLASVLILADLLQEWSRGVSPPMPPRMSDKPVSLYGISTDLAMIDIKSNYVADLERTYAITPKHRSRHLDDLPSWVKSDRLVGRPARSGCNLVRYANKGNECYSMLAEHSARPIEKIAGSKFPPFKWPEHSIDDVTTRLSKAIDPRRRTEHRWLLAQAIASHVSHTARNVIRPALSVRTGNGKWLRIRFRNLYCRTPRSRWRPETCTFRP